VADGEAVAVSTPPSSRQLQFLLGDLCRDLGFCLPPDSQAELISNPPDDIDEFTDAVFRAEGFDPDRGYPRQLWHTVRERVARFWGENDM
jgi:hypothetical protein